MTTQFYLARLMDTGGIVLNGQHSGACLIVNLPMSQGTDTHENKTKFTKELVSESIIEESERLHFFSGTNRTVDQDIGQKLYGSTTDVKDIKGYVVSCCNLHTARVIVNVLERLFGNITVPSGDVVSFITDHYPAANDPDATVERFEAADGARLVDGTTAFTCVSISSEKRYVAPIELFLKKAGLTSSIATFPGDGEGQCFVSDLPAEQVVTNLAAVGIPAKVVEH